MRVYGDSCGGQRADARAPAPVDRLPELESDGEAGENMRQFYSALSSSEMLVCFCRRDGFVVIFGRWPIDINQFRRCCVTRFHRLPELESYGEAGQSTRRFPVPLVCCAFKAFCLLMIAFGNPASDSGPVAGVCVYAILSVTKRVKQARSRQHLYSQYPGC